MLWREIDLCWLEIQALLAPQVLETPRRTSNGFDYNRAMLLLAVFGKRGAAHSEVLVTPI